MCESIAHECESFLHCRGQCPSSLAWVHQLDSSTGCWELVENVDSEAPTEPIAPPVHLVRNIVTAQILKDQNLIPCLELPSKMAHTLLVASQLEELAFGASDDLYLYPDPELGFHRVSAGSRIGRAVWAGAGRKCRDSQTHAVLPAPRFNEMIELGGTFE